MKGKALIIKVLFVAVLAFMLVLSGCDWFMSLFGVTEDWTVSGTVTLTGSPSTPVKLAAFYMGQDTFSSTTSGTIVSNVVTATDGGTFSLDIDVSNITPTDTDLIELIFWEDDATTNDQFDSGEGWEVAEPTDGCPVWDPTTYGIYCWFYYYDASDALWGIDKGWNVYLDLLTWEGIDDATLTGATIENWTTLW